MLLAQFIAVFLHFDQVGHIGGGRPLWIFGIPDAAAAVSSGGSRSKTVICSYYCLQQEVHWPTWFQKVMVVLAPNTVALGIREFGTMGGV